MITKILACSLLVVTSVHANEDEVIDFIEKKTGKNTSTKAVKVVREVDTPFVAELRKNIGASSAEKNIFLSFLNKGSWEKALYQWGSAFRADPFIKTPTGRALHGLLLFKNDLQVSGIEELFQVSNPQGLPNELLETWKEAATSDHKVWSYAVVDWSDSWTKVFGTTTEVRVRARNFHAAKNWNAVVELVKKTEANTPERAWLQWQVALGLAIKGDVGRGARVLKSLADMGQTRVGIDMIDLTAGRLLFGHGYLDESIEYYKKVPKNSEYWFEAQEEMGWAYLRKGEPQNALANTLALVNPAFEHQVGPEGVFLHALGGLKVCDYPMVVKTLENFRKRFQPKAKKLIEQSKTGLTVETEALVTKLKSGRIKLTDLGEAGLWVPRHSVRDEVLWDLVQTQKAFENEAQLAGDLYARSLTGGTAQVGFQAAMEELKQDISKRAQSARAASFSRVKAMAQTELEEITQILQKMHIVEAEVIQQITQAERVLAAKGGKDENLQGEVKATTKDTLRFPYSEEVWFDELTSYKVDLKKGCQAKQ